MEQDNPTQCEKNCYFLVSGKQYDLAGNFCRESPDPKYSNLEEPLNLSGAFPGFPCERGYTESQLAKRIAEEKEDNNQIEGQVFPQEHGIPPIPNVKYSDDPVKSPRLPKCIGVDGIPFRAHVETK